MISAKKLRNFTLISLPILFIVSGLKIDPASAFSLTRWIISRVLITFGMLSYFILISLYFYQRSKGGQFLDSIKKTFRKIPKLLLSFLFFVIIVLGGYAFFLIPGIFLSLLFPFFFFSVLLSEDSIIKSFRKSVFIFIQNYSKILFLNLKFLIFFFIFFLLANTLIPGKNILQSNGIYLLALAVFLLPVLYLIYFLKIYEKNKIKKLNRGLTEISLPLFFLLGLPIFLFCIVLTFNFLYRSFDFEYRDNHLLVEPIEYDKNENLHDFLKQEGFYPNGKATDGCANSVKINPDKLVEENGSYKDYIHKNPEDLEKIIIGNKGVIECIRKMAEYNKFYTLKNSNSEKINVKNIKDPININLWKEFNEAASFHITYLFSKNKEKEALNLLQDALRVNYLLYSTENEFMGYKYAFYEGFYRLITDSTMYYIKNMDLNKEEYLKHADKISSLNLDRDSIINAYKTHYTFLRNIIRESSNKKYLKRFNAYSEINKIEKAHFRLGDFLTSLPINTFLFKENNTLQWQGEVISHKINEMKKNNFFEIETYFSEGSRKKHKIFDYKNTNKFLEDPYSAINFYLIENNAIGKITSSKIIPRQSATSVYRREIDRRKTKTQINLLELLFRLKAYKDKNNEYPGNLTEMTPHFLDEEPNDPFFAKKKIRYSPESGKIYSDAINKFQERKNKQYYMMNVGNINWENIVGNGLNELILNFK